jgi:hypothetical protein
MEPLLRAERASISPLREIRLDNFGKNHGVSAKNRLAAALLGVDRPK